MPSPCRHCGPDAFTVDSDGNPVPVLPPRERLTEWARVHYPGGNHIADHVHDGPFVVVPTRIMLGAGRDDIPATVEEIMAAYPPLEIPLVEYDGVVDGHVFVVPKFVEELLHWHSDGERDFYVVYDCFEEFQFDVEPEPIDLVRHLDVLVSTPFPDGELEKLAARVPFALLLEFLQSLTVEQYETGDELAEVILAYSAAYIPTGTPSGPQPDPAC